MEFDVYNVVNFNILNVKFMIYMKFKDKIPFAQ